MLFFLIRCVWGPLIIDHLHQPWFWLYSFTTFLQSHFSSQVRKIHLTHWKVKTENNSTALNDTGTCYTCVCVCVRRFWKRKLWIQTTSHWKWAGFHALAGPLSLRLRTCHSCKCHFGHLRYPRLRMDHWRPALSTLRSHESEMNPFFHQHPPRFCWSGNRIISVLGTAWWSTSFLSHSCL